MKTDWPLVPGFSVTSDQSLSFWSLSELLLEATRWFCWADMVGLAGEQERAVRKGESEGLRRGRETRERKKTEATYWSFIYWLRIEKYCATSEGFSVCCLGYARNLGCSPGGDEGPLCWLCARRDLSSSRTPTRPPRSPSSPPLPPGLQAVRSHAHLYPVVYFRLPPERMRKPCPGLWNARCRDLSAAQATIARAPNWWRLCARTHTTRQEHASAKAPNGHALPTGFQCFLLACQIMNESTMSRESLIVGGHRTGLMAGAGVRGVARGSGGMSNAAGGFGAAGSFSSISYRR